MTEHSRGGPRGSQKGAGDVDLGGFLRRATAICRALTDYHARGLVHRDIRPDNIAIDPETGAVALAESPIALALDAAGPCPEVLSEQTTCVVGSLPYMSPEQTGRVNRPVDQRSDLYALGVSLFEMLTGSLPFQANDPLEWIHRHLADAPPRARNLRADCPCVVSDIIGKLMSKAPEDRYLSAESLARDLERCLQAWERDGDVADFELGGQEAGASLRFDDILYGRERSLRELYESFARADVYCLDHLINDLLDLGAIETGTFSLDLAPHAPTALVAAAVEAHAPLARDEELELLLRADADLEDVHCDDERVLRVFSNLLGNAIKFTPAGGRIIVRAQRCDRRMVRFSVSDTGPGISRTELPHVFKSHWRFKKGAHKGLGLGWWRDLGRKRTRRRGHLSLYLVHRDLRRAKRAERARRVDSSTYYV